MFKDETVVPYDLLTLATLQGLSIATEYLIQWHKLYTTNPFVHFWTDLWLKSIIQWSSAFDRKSLAR